MAKFIEVTDRGDKKKILIPIDKILSIHEESNGLAFVELYPDISDAVIGFPCAETYIEIFNYLVECELI